MQRIIWQSSSCTVDYLSVFLLLLLICYKSHFIVLAPISQLLTEIFKKMSIKTDYQESKMTFFRKYSQIIAFSIWVNLVCSDIKEHPSCIYFCMKSNNRKWLCDLFLDLKDNKMLNIRYYVISYWNNRLKLHISFR